jgi:hypothetical protein
MKTISLRAHGYLDYATVAVFLLAPRLIGLTGLPAVFAYVLAGVHLLMTVFTEFPLSLVKLIPLRVHGWVEYAVGPALILAALTPPFAQPPARLFYIVMGVAIILVGVLSDFRQPQ